MKILFVHENLGYFGGVEQNIADTVRGLAARGHRSWLAYGQRTEKDVGSYAELFESTFPCKELMTRDDGSTHDSEPFGAILECLRPDVVYSHKVPEVQFLASIFGRIRTVRMVHDHDLCCPRRHKYYAWNGRICDRRAALRCYGCAAFLVRDRSRRTGFRYESIGSKRKEMRRNRAFDRLLVGSRFMRDELLQNGFTEERVAILPPVVRMESPPWVPVPEAPNLLFVGQLIRGKGVDLLLQALAQLSTEFVAKIVGTGNAECNLRTLCTQLGLDERVEFCGWVPNEELGSLYETAKIAVVPSRWPEPFGMVGLEAMRHGRAVAAFGVGGIPDWLETGVTGLSVDEQDVAGLSRALQRLLTEPDLAATLGENARKRVSERFSFERYMDKLESHLHND